MPTKLVKQKVRIDPVALQEILLNYRRLKDVSVGCEAVSAFYGASSVSSFTFGYGFGLIVGVLAVTGFEVTFVRPQVWKTAIFGKDRKKGSQKQRSLKIAHERFGQDPRIKTHDIAEALLIADWLRQKNKENR